MRHVRINKPPIGDCHRPLISLAAITCAVAMVACGSSAKPSSGSGSAQALALASCMRSHGVPNFPDPSAGGGGVDLPSAINTKSPAFKAAQRVCAKLTPGGARGGPRATESQFLAALRFARCARTHGFPSFPDPTRSDSPPGPILVIGTGLYFRVSAQLDPNTPAFERTVAACGRGQ